MLLFFFLNINTIYGLKDCVLIVYEFRVVRDLVFYFDIVAVKIKCFIIGEN